MGLGKTRASVDGQRASKASKGKQRQALGPYYTNRRKVVESLVENGEARWTALTSFGLALKSDAKVQSRGG